MCKNTTLSGFLLGCDKEASLVISRLLGIPMIIWVDNATTYSSLLFNNWTCSEEVPRMLQPTLIGCPMCTCCWTMQWTSMFTPTQSCQPHHTPNPAPPCHTQEQQPHCNQYYNMTRTNKLPSMQWNTENLGGSNALRLTLATCSYWTMAQAGYNKEKARINQ